VSVAAYVHGATLSNWVFMPRNSVVVQIVPRPRPDHVHDIRFTEHMVRRLGRVGVVSQAGCGFRLCQPWHGARPWGISARLLERKDGDATPTALGVLTLMCRAVIPEV
jgi:hypothetical protein